jgi:hypothetical protein
MAGKTKKEPDWKAQGEPLRVSGIHINFDVEGNPYFQARFNITESRKMGGVICIQSREILGEPVYIGKFANPDMYTKYPDFVLAAQVIRTLGPTLRSVVDALSTPRV